MPPYIVPVSDDCSDAICAAIGTKYKMNGGGTIGFTRAIYPVKKTIELRAVNDISFVGAGIGRTDGNYGLCGTVLQWQGPRDVPMFNLNGQHVHFSNLMLDGMDGATTGIWTFYTQGNPSTALSTDRVQFRRFKGACVRAGAQNPEGGNDCFTFRQTNFNNSGVGFLCNSNQSVCHAFYDCQFGDLGVALDIPWGGSINVYAGSCTYSDLFLRVGQSGHNAGQINIYGTKIEPEGKTQKSMRLVEALNGDGVFINLHGLRMSNSVRDGVPDKDATLFRVGPGAVLKTTGNHWKRNGNWPLANISGGLWLSDDDTYFDQTELAKLVKGRAMITRPMDQNGKILAPVSMVN